MNVKLTVKTLKSSHFEIKIMAVKKNIEDVQGKDNYPCGQQLLIHNGKVLKDETTLRYCNVSEDGFLVVMPCSVRLHLLRHPHLHLYQVPSLLCKQALANSLTSDAAATKCTYDQAAINIVTSDNREQTIQHILDIGGGNWDRETIILALRAAYNNPERAVDYLYSGIPHTAELAVPVSQVESNAAAPGAPNLSPLNMFCQESLSGGGSGGEGGLGSLHFLRHNQQFQALRSMVQSNPQIIQPVLQELGKQNSQLLRLIQDQFTEFLQLNNEPPEGDDLFDEPDQEMPHAISVTPAEQEAVERLEAMGFDRALGIEAFLACERNEELAINYLLENAGDNEG